MTPQEREAIYEHCAKLAECVAEKYKSTGNPWVAVDGLPWLAETIRAHAADPVRYP